MKLIKTIHCVWLGKNLDAFANACVNDWQKQGYNVKIWLETDPWIKELIEENKFARECYKRKLYAFVSDWIRLKVLEKYGGFYLDTDVTLLKNIFELVRGYDFIISFENETTINPAIMYSIPNSKQVKAMIEFYEKEIWESNLYIQPMIANYVFKQFGLQQNNKEQEIKGNGMVYTSEYFHSYSGNENYNFKKIDSKTYGVHWFKNSWGNDPKRNFLRCKNKTIFGKLNIYQKYYINILLKLIKKRNRR